MKYTEKQTRAANQKLINEAYAHVNKTKKPSTVDGFCAYSGIGCAFSPAIKAKHRPDADNCVRPKASNIIKKHSDYLYSWAKPIDPHIAGGVQHCHDDNFYHEGVIFLKLFNRDLKKLCKENGYKYPGDQEAEA